MFESPTISKQLPALNSMQYDTLREIGIQRIQELAGALWTDYNTHDPGVTILEAISYILTDIGYRINYDIKDLLAQKLGGADYYDIKNFYTACEILPVCPVTFNDYRKLMIDVEIQEETEDGLEFYGVKNAWILKSDVAEHPIYVNHKKSLLSLDPVPGVTTQDKFYVKTLYDILLEFNKTEKYGDLNENNQEGELTIYEFPNLTDLIGMEIKLTISFPRWDDEVDWDSYVAVRNSVRDVKVKFENVPNGYEFEYSLTNDKRVNISTTSDSNPVIPIDELIDLVNDFLYDPTSGLIVQYVEKVHIIHKIVEAVKKRLHANRNLCDDFLNFNALKVEDILLCTDIEIANTADVEEVQANIYHEISKFLAPTVFFYTLDEMLNKCAIENKYSVIDAIPGENIFTINTKLLEDVGSEDTVSVANDSTHEGEYTVVCIKPNNDNPEYTDVHIEESIETNVLSETAILFVGRIDEELCRTVDEVFEGPKLIHGFIDDNELDAAQLTKVIHVSDLIRIIMDVEGVKAVRNIQIANKPQDNDDGITEKSVKWCLDLAWKYNYVPRLNLDESKITFYKDQLPYIANDDQVEELVEQLEAAERDQKIRYPKMDIDVPLGEFKDLSSYTSLQEELPDIFGTSSLGIPGLSALTDEQQIERKAKAKQLKAFLTFFDQLVANEMTQLDHVKDLFSMNSEKNEFGEYQIDKTYFSQPLYDVIPNADPLYIDKAGHLVSLQNITEDQSIYIDRRNKFLDHLLGRFAESFTDYALLAYKIDSSRAGLDLIEDKLQFLNRYPEISAQRGKAMDYYQDCYQWHLDNISGLERRTSFLTGINEKTYENLVFGDNFTIDLNLAGFTILNDSNNPLINQATSLDDELAVKELLEKLIMVASCKSNYTILENESGKFYFEIQCENHALAISTKTNYNNANPNGALDKAIDKTIAVCKREYFNNHESNRKNLACPLANYIQWKITVDMSPVDPDPPTYTLSYTLYSKPFDFVTENEIMKGSITEPAQLGDSQAIVEQKAEDRLDEMLWSLIYNASARSQYLLDDTLNPYIFQLCDRHGDIIGDSIENNFNDALAAQISASSFNTLVVSDSSHNDGTYTINIAASSGPTIKFTVDEIIPSPIFDGQLSWEEGFTIDEINLEERWFKMDNDIADRYEIGDLLEVRNSTSNDGFYSIRGIEDDGGQTILKVNNPIPSVTTDGLIMRSFIFEMIGINANTFAVKGGMDEKAIQQFISFIYSTFFNHEGMHLIEHTLLRPRINEKLFVPIESNTLKVLGGTSAKIIWPKSTNINKVNAPLDIIFVADNIKTELASDDIKIIDGPYDNMELTIANVTTVASKSKIKVNENLKLSLPKPPFANGSVQYQTATDIKKILPASSIIVVEEEAVTNMNEGDIVIIKGDIEQNNGVYKIESVRESGPNFRIKLSARKEWVKDALLPIQLDQECEACQHVDPYSCIVSVILPWWPNRFVNLDFRKFVEHTLRLEAPAHILLNICWINCNQMEEFEQKYKQWLLEINKPTWNKPALSKSLKEFIEILVAARNVYPGGTLHSCDEDESLEGAIILNNSVLGTF